jgi:hypothetical protein
LYRLTWKRRATPSGRQIPALRASARPISGSGSTGWPTPHENSTTGPGSAGREGGDNIQTAAQLAAWPTPTTRDWKDGSPNANVPVNALLGREVWAAGWATPVVQHAAGTPERFLERKRESMARGSQSMGVCLSDLAMQVQAWAPGPARLTASGEMLTGSAARMESGGQLHPEHSLWLQLGPFATAWASCGVRVTRSTSRKPRASSKP